MIPYVVPEPPVPLLVKLNVLFIYRYHTVHGEYFANKFSHIHILHTTFSHILKHVYNQ